MATQTVRSVAVSKGTAFIGVLTVSDRASAGVYEDRGGPAIVDFLTAHLVSPWEAVRKVVPDETDLVRDAIVELAATCCLVVTTGGTGPSPRDVTPEATEQACHKLLPGFGELMRQVSLQVVPTAILSRQTAGICGQSLVINLPGKPSSIADCLTAVLPAVPYCVDLAATPERPNPRLELGGGISGFRPKGA
jgi:molybdopterin adenylyltransferase